MYNLYTIALLYDVRTPTEPFKRKIVSKKLTPACDVAFAAEALVANYRPWKRIQKMMVVVDFTLHMELKQTRFSPHRNKKRQCLRGQEH